MRFFAYHGVLPQERRQGQFFEVDVELYLPPSMRGAQSDLIQETIDYRQVYGALKAVVEQQQYHLIEALAEELAGCLLKKYPLTGVRLQVRKPEVLLPGPIQWAGIEIYRAQHEEKRWTSAYLGLGSNLGDREANLWQALGLLAAHPGLRVVKVSSFYETKPVGNVAQGPFINAVAQVDTIHPGQKLYQILKAVEEHLGRRREKIWGPRTIDLDLLLFGKKIIQDPDLLVPHPYLEVRDFVLVPLAEIAPDLVLPRGIYLAEALAKLANLPSNLLSKWPSHAKIRPQ